MSYKTAAGLGLVFGGLLIAGAAFMSNFPPGSLRKQSVPDPAPVVLVLPKADTTAESLDKDTAGAIMISVGESPEAIIFVSKTGNVLAVRPEACQAKPECIALLDALQASKHINTLELKPHHVQQDKGSESV